MVLPVSQSVESNTMAAAQVTQDLTCVECGYNLRTLSYAGQCPECGMSVLVSARGDWLAGADPDWLRALVHGAWWLRASIFMAFPSIYPGVMFSCYAIWVLTLAQPGRTEPAMDRGYRLAARWMTILGSLVVVILTFGALIAVMASKQKLLGDWTFKLRPGAGGGGAMRGVPLYDILFLTGHAVYVLGLLASWRYLRILAERVPDENQAYAWRALGRCWLASVLIVVGVCVLAYLLVQTRMLPGGSTSMWTPLALGVFFAVMLMSLWGVTLRVAGRQVGVLREVRHAAGHALHVP